MVKSGQAGSLAELGGAHWGLLPGLLLALWLSQTPTFNQTTAVWLIWLAGIMASYDLASRRIPNPLCALAALSGLAWGLAGGGWQGLLSALYGGGLGFSLMAVFYFLGAVGAGDVKALAALATFLGPWGALQLFIFTTLAGGVMALGFILAGAGKGACFAGGGIGGLVKAGRGLEMPYGLAIAGGSLALVLLGGVS